MPKMKSHSGATKRLRVSPSGKVLRAQAGVRHLLEHKASKRKRNLEGAAEVAPADQRRARRLLGS